ncbi:chaperone NapD [Billgrantia sp. Q4P2]|uniref:chaperone NapD n=1 Tax=Billgrantia sp. Q4P2 TaxID=3463857 RepID=UPI004057BC68
MDDEVHISSLVVQVRPQHIDALQVQCSAFDGVEIPAVDPVGKMVVLLEMPSQRRIVEIIDWLQEREGVLSVSMVYHHMESRQELDREVEAHDADTA